MKYKSKAIKLTKTMMESAKANQAMTKNEKEWILLHFGTLKESLQKIPQDPVKTKIRGSKIRSVETAIMLGAPKGTCFYSTKEPKDITALASNLKVKVSTQVLYTIHPNTMKTQKITKITLL
jgi:hypothetical protein